MNSPVLSLPNCRTDSGHALAFARAFVEDADQPFTAARRDLDMASDFPVDDIEDDDEMRHLLGQRPDSLYEE